MTSDIKLLQELRIASPCEASWDDMRGDDKVRFCEHCQLNVYNLPAMEIDEAAALVRETEGRLCARFFMRPDGRMLVEDCPVGFRAARRQLLGRMALAGAAFLGLFGPRLSRLPAIQALGERLQEAGRAETTMGVMPVMEQDSNTVDRKPSPPVHLAEPVASHVDVRTVREDIVRHPRRRRRRRPRR